MRNAREHRGTVASRPTLRRLSFVFTTTTPSIKKKKEQALDNRYSLTPADVVNFPSPPPRQRARDPVKMIKLSPDWPPVPRCSSWSVSSCDSDWTWPSLLPLSKQISKLKSRKIKLIKTIFIKNWVVRWTNLIGRRVHRVTGRVRCISPESTESTNSPHPSHWR